VPIDAPIDVSIDKASKRSSAREPRPTAEASPTSLVAASPSPAEPSPAPAPTAASPDAAREEIRPEPSPITPAPVAPGVLLVLVTPWAYVAVDGVPVGMTPLAPIRLAPGPYAVVLTHPDYQPFPRKVPIVSGETFRLTVDLKKDAIAKRR